MRSRSLLICCLACFAFLHAAALFGQGPDASAGDEEKRRQFLRAREEMRTVPATPAPAATPAPKPKPKPRAIPTAAPATPKPAPAVTPPPTPRPRATPEPPPIRSSTPMPREVVATPEPTPKARPTPEPTPRPREKEPTPRPVTPRLTPVPTPVTPPPVTPPPKPRDDPPAPVTIEKSGFEEERGIQPATTGGWFTKWKYLSKGVRQEIDRAPVLKRRWRYIVVHNSGTRQGNAKAFEYYHRRVRRMQNGLAYHFVIGNGTSSGDGQIEIGNRWRRQVNGGHVHSDYLNNIALGICLVGDLNRDAATKRQLAAMDELIRYLRQRVGKIDRQWAIVKAHKDINPPRWPTDCPGDRFDYRWLHSRFD